MWRAGLRGQISSGNLLGSEQLAFGGAAGLRGYDEGEVYADEGLLLTNKFEWASRRLAARFGAVEVADLFTPRIFVDAGVARVREPLPGEPRTTDLLSVGVGFRYSVGAWFDLNADYGWQLEDTGLNGRNNHRGHLSATVSW